MIRTVVFIIAFSLCVSAVSAKDEKSIKKLRDALVALAPDVDPGEAELLSVTAHTASRRLAREYGLLWSPIFQNFLIHMGKRQRGYCGHWTRDIGECLKDLRFRTLALHWGAYKPGTTGESNCVVITARNQSFQDGIVIDGWRRAGRLYWAKVTKDDEYQWKEDASYTAWLQDYRHVYEFRSERR